MLKRLLSLSACNVLRRRPQPRRQSYHTTGALNTHLRNIRTSSHYLGRDSSRVAAIFAFLVLGIFHYARLFLLRPTSDSGQ